jgi:hypothetical protein
MTRPAALLFDLDGTLVDSAPDLAGAANDLLAARQRPACDYPVLRPHAGSGARGMIGAAFGLAPGDAGYDALRDEFLQVYATRLLRHTQLFDEVSAVFEALQAAGVPIGIVTNKALHLDAQRWDDWLALYTEDAVFWLPAWTDEHRLAELRFLGERPREDVGRTAGREGHHHAQRALRPGGLAQRSGGQHGGQRQRDGTAAQQGASASAMGHGNLRVNDRWPSRCVNF